MPQPPVIIIPGITASRLDDFYKLPPEKIWDAPTLLGLPVGFTRKFERTSLHPDDMRYELKEPSLVKEVSTFALVYGDLLEELRDNLTTGDKVTPVFPFAYDWRVDCAITAGKLDAFIDEVMERTSLLAHYRGEEVLVDIVAHSMGGMITADYLRRFGKKNKVRRVVTLGTPFQGSLDAVLKLIIGKGHLTGDNPRDREREMARITPALYELVPSFQGAVISNDPNLIKLFEPDAWQPSLLNTLQKFIDSVKAQADAQELFSRLLNNARLFIGRLNKLNLEQALPEGLDGWLPIVGVGCETQVSIENNRTPEGVPRFNVLDDEDNWSAGDPGSPKTGDGTVPFLGALPQFMPKNRVVCVCPDDLSRWEIADRILVTSQGLHSFLPAVNLVQRLATRFFRDNYHGHVWGWKPPTVTKADWSPPGWLERRYKD